MRAVLAGDGGAGRDACARARLPRWRSRGRVAPCVRRRSHGAFAWCTANPRPARRRGQAEPRVVRAGGFCDQVAAVEARGARQAQAGAGVGPRRARRRLDLHVEDPGPTGGARRARAPGVLGAHEAGRLHGARACAARERALLDTAAGDAARHRGAPPRTAADRTAIRRGSAGEGSVARVHEVGVSVVRRVERRIPARVARSAAGRPRSRGTARRAAGSRRSVRAAGSRRSGRAARPAPGRPRP